MALAPAFRGHRIGSANAKHTLEFYLDYVCPFSKKQVFGIRDDLLPLLKDKDDLLTIIFRQTPQPWHGSSTYVHEAAIAVGHLAPDKFWDFSYKLMEQQEDYFDEGVEHRTVNEIRSSLAALAENATGLDKKAVLEELTIGKGNAGTKVTGDLKLAIKYGRQNGVHVTPTVALDGLIDPSISSSFTKADWDKYIKEKLT